MERLKGIPSPIKEEMKKGHYNFFMVPFEFPTVNFFRFWGPENSYLSSVELI